MLVRSCSYSHRRAKHAKRMTLCLLKAITGISQRSQRVRWTAAMNAYLRNRHVKENAVERAYCRIGLRRDIRFDVVARSLDMFSPPDNVSFHIQPRTSGGFRTIYHYGPSEIARQLILLDLLKAAYKRPVWQYDQKGRGRDVAIREIRSLARAGCHYYCSFDIRTCFQSFEGERIANILSLPEEVVRHNITTDSFVHGSEFVSDTSPYRTNPQSFQLGGIPQGSITSSYVAGILLSNLTEMLPPDTTIFLYADDIVVLSPTMARIDEAQIALTNGLLDHRSGCLRLRRFECGSFRDKPLDFLGYKMALDGDNFSISLSDDNEIRLTDDWWRAVERDRLLEDEDVPAVRNLLLRRVSGFQMAATDAIWDSLIAGAREIVRQEKLVSGVPRIYEVSAGYRRRRPISGAA